METVIGTLRANKELSAGLPESPRRHRRGIGVQVRLATSTMICAVLGIVLAGNCRSFAVRDELSEVPAQRQTRVRLSFNLTSSGKDAVLLVCQTLELQERKRDLQFFRYQFAARTTAPTDGPAWTTSGGGSSGIEPAISTLGNLRFSQLDEIELTLPTEIAVASRWTIRSPNGDLMNVESGDWRVSIDRSGAITVREVDEK